MINSHIILLDSHTVRLCYNTDIMYVTISRVVFFPEIQKGMVSYASDGIYVSFNEIRGQHKWRTEVHFLLIISKWAIVA